MNTLAGERALVTGAAGAIGGEIARALAAEGVALLLHDREVASLTPRAAELAALGVSCDVVAADLAETSQVEALAETALAAGVSILVNNAGIATPAAYARFSGEEIVRHVAVNQLAPMLLTRALLPSLLERRSGHIVFVASLAGIFGSAYAAPYGATKAALIALARALRTELRGSGVGVSAVCPGFVGGGLTDVITGAGVAIPPSLGLLQAEQVAQAVVRAIRDDRAEIALAARGPVRPLIVASAISPGLRERIVGISRMAEPFRETARRNGRL